MNRKAHNQAAQAKRLADEKRRVSHCSTIMRKNFTREIKRNRNRLNDLGRQLRKAREDEEFVTINDQITAVFYRIAPDVLTATLLEIQENISVENYEEIRT